MTKFSRYSNALGLMRIGMLALVFSLLALVNLPTTASGQDDKISADSLVGKWLGYGVNAGDDGEDCSIKLGVKKDELILTSSGGTAIATFDGKTIKVIDGWPDTGIEGKVTFTEGTYQINWGTRRTDGGKSGGHWKMQ